MGHSFSLKSNFLKPTLIAVGISMTLAMTGCKGEQANEEVITVVRPVVTEFVNHNEVEEFFFNGTVAAASRADLSFRSSGRVVELLVDEGSEVEKGQILARLESSDQQVALTAAKTELENTRTEYQRAKTLFERQQSISKSTLDELTLRFRLAENRVQEAQYRLNDTFLIAPFNGLVSRKFIDNHTMVQANENIVAIHDLSDMEVVIDVPEQLMTKPRPGAELYATTTLVPNQRFALKVKTFSTEPNSTTRTYSVKLGFLDLDQSPLLPGMNIRVISNWQVTDMTSVNIPLTAVNPDNTGNQYVWVVDENNIVNQRIVKTGALIGDRIQVLSNLSDGEQIVVSGTRSLVAGTEVRPMAKEVR
ncbi:efflux RND transporter periplasmic adaptor subunit [Vibrio agarivorans]|uniref:Efflux RND transporter periplasmic adaptor subunit n=1 Tax=Vibrio agarivorans TaxID=153622 RepID=A0ABT7Y578_9VIBR|nr:efflux RND transporter periplasmic adaptor subunit [Vibrio agarivorans]